MNILLQDAKVDQKGQISLAPEWSNDPGVNLESGPGAAELTRGMLEVSITHSSGFWWVIIFDHALK